MYALLMQKVLTEANMGIYNKEVIVNLKQKQYDWQSADVITIGGISHSVKEGDTDNWIGKPGAGGTCKVSFDQENGNQICVERGWDFCVK